MRKNERKIEENGGRGLNEIQKNGERIISEVNDFLRGEIRKKTEEKEDEKKGKEMKKKIGDWNKKLKKRNEKRKEETKLLKLEEAHLSNLIEKEIMEKNIKVDGKRKISNKWRKKLEEEEAKKGEIIKRGTEEYDKIWREFWHGEDSKLKAEELRLRRPEEMVRVLEAMRRRLKKEARRTKWRFKNMKELVQNIIAKGKIVAHALMEGHNIKIEVTKEEATIEWREEIQGRIRENHGRLKKIKEMEQIEGLKYLEENIKRQRELEKGEKEIQDWLEQKEEATRELMEEIIGEEKYREVKECKEEIGREEQEVEEKEEKANKSLIAGSLSIYALRHGQEEEKEEKKEKEVKERREW